MKRELKQKIKQDELVSGIQHASIWAGGHAHDLKMTVAIVAAVAVLGGGLFWFQRHRQEASEQALSSALEVFHADVAGQTAEGSKTALTFGSAPEKFGKAAAAFDDVASRYGSTAAGRRARYYGALCRVELGQYDAAEKTLGELAARDPGSLEAGLARLALAGAHHRAGKLDQAVGEYKQMADDPSFALPRDYALMQLGQVLEDARKGSEAAASYRRLAEEFPDSAYAAEARRRADALKTDQG